MDPQIATRAVPTLRVVACGVDSLYLFWRAPLDSVQMKDLAERKLEAVESEGKLPTVLLGGQLFDVQPNSGRAGPLLLTNENMSVVLNPRPPAGLPTAMIDLKAIWLWQRGPDAAVADAQAVIFELAADQADDDQLAPRVTRADFCLDVQGWKPQADQLVPRGARFYDHRNEKLHCRSRKFALIGSGSRFESARYGKKCSGVSAEIYNKSLEIEVHGKEWFEKDVWAKSPNYQAPKMVDGELVKDDVIRIEFRLLREGLTDFQEKGGLEQLDTWEDIRKNIRGLWSYLTRSWLVMRGQRSAKDRLANAVEPFWQQIVDAGELHMGSEGVLRQRYAKIGEKCMKAFAGYLLLNHMCLLWVARNQRPTLEQTAPKILEECLAYAAKSWDVPAKIAKRLAKWQASEHASLMGEDVLEEMAA